MKEYLRSLVNTSRGPIQGRNIAREYLQARVLETLQRSGAFVSLAFQGGTALRFLYGLHRFSEDLDFSLENPTADYAFQAYLKDIKSTFIKEGYNLEIVFNLKHTVHSAFLKFIELPFELGLSPHQNENLSIKIEVDTNPPKGAGLDTSLVRKYIFLNLYHYDRASLFAGKIHALLSRKFTKGRDIYDLFWYLSDPDWPLPNFFFLKNALIQTDWVGDFPDERNWRSILLNKINSLDWSRVVADVSPFLEGQDEVNILTKNNLISLLTKPNVSRK
jgi:predicted nucleotidyltransferase component of viral defense system